MEAEEPSQKKALEQIKSNLRLIVDEKAYQRMMNVGMVNPNLFANAAQRLVMAYQKFGRKINEREVLVLLHNLREKPKEGNISIKRK